MPKVRVPRKNVTPGELVTVLNRRLGPGYRVESNGDGRVIVRKSSLLYANISIADAPGASVFRIWGTSQLASGEALPRGLARDAQRFADGFPAYAAAAQLLDLRL